MTTIDDVLDEVVQAEEREGPAELAEADEEELPSEQEADPDPRSHLDDPEERGVVPDEGETRAQLVRITEILGARLFYERWNRPPGPLPFSVAPSFKPVIERTVQHVKARAPQSWGALERITSGGTFVGKPGAHGSGKAIDWDRFTFANVEIAPKDKDHVSPSLATRRRYWALAAICRANSSYVLHGAYDEGPHDDHIHQDPTGDRGFVRKHSTITLVQAICNEIFDRRPKLKVDGDLGQNTQRAIEEAKRKLGLAGGFDDVAVWTRFLLGAGRLGFTLAKEP
jgi:hypothetical protein